MTPNDILEMASAAGFMQTITTSPPDALMLCEVTRSFEVDSFSTLCRFANLVAAKEREACAQVCEARCDPNIDSNTAYADHVADGVLNDVLDKIRARGGV